MSGMFSICELSRHCMQCCVERAKTGHPLAPASKVGRVITTTRVHKAWCNLTSESSVVYQGLREQIEA
jgi:hypothetical protein